MTGDEVARVILRGLKLWVALLEKALGTTSDKQPTTASEEKRQMK